ncbi:MAG: ABC transporter ATP-binding protein [Promethearchaeati archaeon SRVP18_Atabeyarchaeia-1]
MLEVKKIYHYYGKARALEDVSLNVESKTLDAVIGPNGAGKTTLLRAITGLEEIDRGTITFKGERIDELEPYEIARKGIAHCPERRRLFPDMSVMENLDMGAYSVKDKSKIKSLMKLVFKIFPVLEHRRRQTAGTLSGGEQQMLAIGRALMANPKLLLMDEPSLGLAPKVKTRIFEAINEIKKTGTTTLLVEQDAVLALEVAENLHVLEEGKIEMRGTPKELRKEPRMKEVYLGIA